jgi:V8-like Glu-specific endopeptidase
LLARKGEGERPMKTAQLFLEALEERQVPSLTPVAPTAVYPYTAIVEIQVTFKDGKSFVGSGAMVDRFHVLTAGHVLYDAADGGWASSVKVVPELNGSHEPFGYALGTHWTVFDGWIKYNQAHPGMTAPGDFDMGLITLDRTIGDRTGWFLFGYNNNNAAFASGTIMNTAGYPASHGYNGLQMEWSGGGIVGLSSDGMAIRYNQSSITTYGGSSGSPLWELLAGGSRVIYGVVAGGSGAANSVNIGTRITQAMFNTLQNDRLSDPVPRSDWFSADPSGANVFVSTNGTGNTTVFSFMSQPEGTALAHNIPDLTTPVPASGTDFQSAATRLQSSELSPSTLSAILMKATITGSQLAQVGIDKLAGWDQSPAYQS